MIGLILVVLLVAILSVFVVSSATANPVMTGVAQKYIVDARNFAAKRLFPVFRSGEQSAKYYVLNEENLLNIPRNIQRAPGTNWSRALMKVSDDSYSTIQYGHEEPVDDRERRKYATYFDADAAATRRATNVVIINAEIRVKTKATDAAVPTSTPATKWNAAGSDPIADVDTAKTNIVKNCGMEANILVTNRDVFNVLKEHTKVLDKIKYSERGIITQDILAAVFGVEEFVVAGALENTAQEGQAITPNFIWGDIVILAHRESAQDLMLPNFGRTFAWVGGEVGAEGVAVQSYREDPISSDVHRVFEDVDEKLVGAKAGYHISDVLT